MIGSTDDFQNSNLINILELPEIVTHIFRNLDTEERARKRLINSIFNNVYLVEEENELLQLWNKYQSGYCGGYYVKPLSDAELIALEQQFDMKMQYHLKVWLTKCSNGRSEWAVSLLSIANTGDWDKVTDLPYLQPWQFELLEHFGEELENFLCVHFSHNKIYIMDKRNGAFYHSSNGNRLYWQKIGNFKEWLQKISYDILYPLSETRGEFICEQLYQGLEELYKFTSSGDISKDFLKSLSQNPKYYVFLNDEWKRKEEVIESLLDNSYENLDGFILHLPAHIPFELRNDKDFLLKYFRIADFSYYIPRQLRNDKPFMKELISKYSTCFHTRSLSKDIIRDTEVLKTISQVIHTSIEEQEIIEWGLETVEQVKTYFKEQPNSHISIPYISDIILNDKLAMIDIMNEVYDLKLSPNEPITDLSVIEKIVGAETPMILSIIDDSIRNDKEFMTKLGGISLMFIGNELKKDLDIISNVKTSVLKKLNLKLSKQEYLELFEKIQENRNIRFTFLYNLNMFDALKYQIPREYFNDSEFCLDTFRITGASDQYFGKFVKQDVEFWEKVAKMEINLFGAPPELFIRNRDLALNHSDILGLPEELICDEEFLKQWVDIHEYDLDGLVCLPRKARSKKFFTSLLTKYPFVKKFVPEE